MIKTLGLSGDECGGAVGMMANWFDDYGEACWTVVRTATLECTAATVPRGEGEACLRARIRVASNCPKPGHEGFLAVFDAHRLHRACLRRTVYTVERWERLMQATQN